MRRVMQVFFEWVCFEFHQAEPVMRASYHGGERLGLTLVLNLQAILDEAD